MAKFEQSPSERRNLESYYSPGLRAAVLGVAKKILDIADLPGRGTKAPPGMKGTVTPEGGAPVDSGRLIVSGKLEEEGSEVRVVYEAPYIGYVYFGSENNVPPNPFLHRAIDEIAKEK